MTVLILAAGQGTRWKVNNPMRIQKQLIPINGDPIIARTVKMCRRYAEDPMVVTNDPEIVASADGVIEVECAGNKLDSAVPRC